ADWFDLSVVELTRIRHRGTVVVADLNRTRVSSVPAPGQTKFPCTPVRAEQSAECSELKPTQVEFSGELGRRDEPSDIRTPIRNAGERGVDGDGNLGLQGLPRGIHISRPQERCVALH